MKILLLYTLIFLEPVFSNGFHHAIFSVLTAHLINFDYHHYSGCANKCNADQRRNTNKK